MSHTFYTYILSSDKVPGKFYVGFTDDLTKRIRNHNMGLTTATAKLRPWSYYICLSFPNAHLAEHMEAYFKSGSGRAFVKRHFKLDMTGDHLIM